MIQDTYQKAIKFAGEKHASQQVPGTDSNYVVHLSNVAMEVLFAYFNGEEQFDLEFAIQIALLHDSIEDTGTTYEELKEVFGAKIADGVQALTKDASLSSKEEKMKDSLSRIKQLNVKEVSIVKLADRITNLQPPPSYWSQEKVAAYRKEAKMIAEELSDCNAYLSNRIQGKIKSYGWD